MTGEKKERKKKKERKGNATLLQSISDRSQTLRATVSDVLRFRVQTR